MPDSRRISFPQDVPLGGVMIVPASFGPALDGIPVGDMFNMGMAVIPRDAGPAEVQALMRIDPGCIAFHADWPPIQADPGFLVTAVLTAHRCVIIDGEEGGADSVLDAARRRQPGIEAGTPIVDARLGDARLVDSC